MLFFKYELKYKLIEVLNKRERKRSIMKRTCLRYFQELSYDEISKEIQIPLNNVKIKLLRAKKLLAEIILTKK